MTLRQFLLSAIGLLEVGPRFVLPAYSFASRRSSTVPPTARMPRRTDARVTAEADRTRLRLSISLPPKLRARSLDIFAVAMQQPTEWRGR